MEFPVLITVHLASSLYLTGLIWTVQRVHYPAYEYVDRGRFAAYQEFHMRRITPVVAPVMIVEAVAAMILLAYRPTDLLAIVGALLVLAIWVITFQVQVPRHARLECGYDATLVRELVAFNWARTLLWTARSLIAAAWLFRG